MGRKNNKRKKEYKKEVQLYKGNFEITRSGMGFVIVTGLERDIIIRPNDFNKAFHGDLVRVEITKGDIRAGRLQGKIVQVVERNSFLSTYHQTSLGNGKRFHSIYPPPL